MSALTPFRPRGLISAMASLRSFSSSPKKEKTTWEQKLQPVKGTHDRYGYENERFMHLAHLAAQAAQSFGYSEISTPILEHSELFERTLGSDSDIVSKEMYSFVSAGSDERITLRPEGTAGAVRAILNSTLHLPMPQKYYYCGPMFRRERPQKGRLRQFHQFGVEFVGSDSEYSDLEIIDMAWRFLKDLGVDQKVELRINTLGDSESRAAYKGVLERYFREQQGSGLSEQSKARLEKGTVLRILDSKDPGDQQLAKGAPSLLDHLSPSSQKRFANVRQGLQQLKIPFKEDSTLVRGLDYYSDTVFEFVTTQLGAQGTVLAGGRYDRLFNILGHANPLPGVGWASGLERLVLLAHDLPLLAPKNLIAVINTGEEGITSPSSTLALETGNQLRDAGFTVSSWLWLSPKKQLSKAASLNASHAVFVGDAKTQPGQVVLKNLATREEEIVFCSELPEKIK